jgi:hypothetical protein
MPKIRSAVFGGQPIAPPPPPTDAANQAAAYDANAAVAYSVDKGAAVAPAARKPVGPYKRRGS